MRTLSVVRHGTQLAAEVSLVAASRDWLESFPLAERVGILVGIGLAFGLVHYVIPCPPKVERQMKPKLQASSVEGSTNPPAAPAIPAVRIELSAEAAAAILSVFLRDKGGK